MRKLRISKSLALPVDAVTQRISILGRTRSGKSHTAGVIVEEVLKAHQQVVILDPKGDWSGLRSSADGKSAGLDIHIMGGKKGDIPLEPTAGALIADLVVNEGISIVLDLSLFDSKADEIRFATAFLDRLYRKNTEPVLLVVDEADVFCLSADTEILSASGWKRYDQLSLGEEVVCFNLESETYSYGPVQRIIAKEHIGKMVALETKSLDCLVTPDHRVVLRRMQRAKGRYGLYPWTFEAACKVPTCVGIPSGGAPIGTGIPDLTERDARILGWLMSDGNVQHQNGKHLSDQNFRLNQATITKKGGLSISKEMTCVLENVNGVSRYERKPRTRRGRETSPSIAWYFNNEASERYRHWVGSQLKRIPRSLVNGMSLPQLKALYEGLLEGDGHKDEDGSWRVFYPGQNEGLADDFQEVALRLGVNTVKTWITSIGQWVVSIADLRRSHWLKRRRETIYEGIVWDVTVPTGAFVARRNGTIFVTGNCPQRPEKNETTMLNRMETICRRGAGRGIGVVLISQRSAALHKGCLSQTELMIAHQTTAPQDKEAIKEWVVDHGDEEQRESFLTRIPKLKTGTAIVWSPSWLEIYEEVTIRRKETYDSGDSPKVGQRRRAPKVLAQVDLERLKKHMSETIEKAKQEDPKLLRAEIQRLKLELAKKPAHVVVSVPRPTPAAVQTTIVRDRIVEVPALKPGEIKKMRKLVESIDKARADLGSSTKSLETAATALYETVAKSISAIDRAKRKPDVAQPIILQVQRPQPPKRMDAPAATQKNGEGGVTLLAGERKMLEVLAQFHPGTRTKSQLGALSGYTPSGGTFSNYFGTLRRNKLVKEDVSGAIVITEAGLDWFGSARPTPPSSTDELLEMWRGKLLAGERKMLDVLVKKHPDPISKEALGGETGYTHTGGTFGNYLGTLRRNALAEVDGEQVKASKALFELGAVGRGA